LGEGGGGDRGLIGAPTLGTVPSVLSSGVRICFEDLGSGQPIVLLHGFTGSVVRHWRQSGWLDYLAQTHRVVAVDQRAHGDSDKPEAQDAYSVEILAGDVLAVLDVLSIPQSIVFGYSMGGLVTIQLLLNHRQRVAAAVIAGMGSRLARRSD